MNNLDIIIHGIPRAMARLALSLTAWFHIFIRSSIPAMAGTVLLVAACSTAKPKPVSLADRTVMVLVEDGMGSGFLVAGPDGRRLVVTADHVVQASTNPWVEMKLPGEHGGFRARLRASVVWADPDSDLALLALDDEAPLAKLATVDLTPQSVPAVRPFKLAGYSLDRVTGDVTEATELEISITAWDVPVPLPDPLLGVRRTVPGHTASAPGAHRGTSGGGVIDGTGALIGIVVVGNEADGAIGIVAPEPLRHALGSLSFGPASAPTSDELVAAVAHVVHVVGPASTVVQAIDAGSTPRTAIDQLPPAAEYLPPSDLAAIRAGNDAPDSADGARSERELAVRAAAWALDGMLGAAPATIVAIRRHGDNVVEADVNAGGVMRSMTFRREHGRWQWSVRGTDGEPYAWEAAAAWAFEHAHGTWHADGGDGLTVDVTLAAEGMAVRGVLRASNDEMGCEVSLTGRAAAGETGVTLAAESTTDSCAGVTRVALEDVREPTTILAIDDSNGRHEIPVTKVITTP